MATEAVKVAHADLARRQGQARPPLTPPLLGLLRPGIELFDLLILRPSREGERQMFFERPDRLGKT